MVILEVISALNKEIRLTEVQFSHIILHHPEIKNQEDKIISTLQEPDLVLFDEPKNNYNYYKKFESTPVTEKMLHAIVKHLNSGGFIITTYFTDKIMSKGRVVVYERSNNEL